MNKFFLLLVVAIGFLAVLFDSFATFESKRKASLLVVEQARVDKEIEFFEILLSNLMATQAGVRGYVATGDKLYLEAYSKSLTFLKDPEINATLLKYIEERPSLIQLKALIDEKIGYLHKIIDLYNAQGLKAVQDEVIGGFGQGLMDKIWIIDQRFILEKDQVLANKEKDLKDQLEKINIFSSITNWVGFLLMATCLLAIYTYASRSEKEKKDLISLEKLRNEIMSNARGIILTLDPKGCITSFNKMVERISGFPFSEVIGTPFSQFIDAEDDKINLQNFSKKYSKQFDSFSDLLLFAKEHPIEEDVIWTFKKNERRFFQASITPLVCSEGFFTGYLIEANEISERVKLNEKLIEARAEAENANRAKSQFLTSMSHDLRTPLTAIIGYVDILDQNRGENLTEKQLTYIKRIGDNSQYLLEMVQDIMALEKFEARKETIQFSEVRVGNLIEQIFEELEIKATQKGIILKAEGLEGLEPLHTDEQKLYRILMNLIANGVKFTDEGSIRVVITQDKLTHQPIQIDVIDMGIGIDSAYHDQVFQPFFQVNRATKKGDEGTGLGLSICKSYSQLLGYKLSFKSELGKGSTFTLDLS